MVLVDEQRYYSGCRTSVGGPQYNCGPRIPRNEGLVRLDIESQDLLQDPAEMGPTRNGHVCIQTDNSAEEVLQLETRPRSLFNQNWSNLQGRGYANPSWNLVGRVLNRIQQQ